jgi:hypothetical protein
MAARSQQKKPKLPLQMEAFGCTHEVRQRRFGSINVFERIGVVPRGKFPRSRVYSCDIHACPSMQYYDTCPTKHGDTFADGRLRFMGAVPNLRAKHRVQTSIFIAEVCEYREAARACKSFEIVLAQ